MCQRWWGWRYDVHLVGHWRSTKQRKRDTVTLRTYFFKNDSTPVFFRFNFRSGRQYVTGGLLSARSGSLCRFVSPVRHTPSAGRTGGDVNANKSSQTWRQSQPVALLSFVLRRIPDCTVLGYVLPHIVNASAISHLQSTPHSRHPKTGNACGIFPHQSFLFFSFLLLSLSNCYVILFQKKKGTGEPEWKQKRNKICKNTCFFFFVLDYHYYYYY